MRQRSARPAFAPPNPADLRVGPLLPIPALLREAGIDPLPVIEGCGLDVAVFAAADTEARIAFDRATKLIEECARLTGRADFGLLIGQRFEFASMGVLALLMANAPDVGSALANLQRWFHLHDRGAMPYLRDLGGGSVAFGYTLADHGTPGAGLAFDTAMAIAWRLLRTLCGPGWRPTLVALSRRAPRSAAAYRRYFDAPIHFDAAHSEIQFDAAWLAAPVAGADAARLAAVQRAAEQMDQGRQRSFTERTRATAQALALVERASAARIAAVLGVHERSLRRQLQAEGTSLQAILGQTRFELACQLLRETRLPLADIAAALGYADAAALSRAFKKQQAGAAIAPGQWRRRLA